MKKMTILIHCMMTIAAFAVAQPSKATLTKTIIAADNVFLKAFRTGNVSELDGIIAPEFFNHTGEHRGLDSLKSSITHFHRTMKPVCMNLIRQLADHEYVADWVRYNFAAPGTAIEGVEMTRYLGGKAVEHWVFPYMRPRKP